MVYFSTDVIKEYFYHYKVTWPSRKLANDQGNLYTPTPAIGVFMELLEKEECLFSQEDYIRYAWSLPEWKKWKKILSLKQIEGVEARLYRNFYPSAIDNLYVYALLMENKDPKFIKCIINTEKDVTSKIDITVFAVENKPIYIGLKSLKNNENSKWTEKKLNRGDQPKYIINVYLPEDRFKYPGNKRWYQYSDLQEVFNRAKEDINILQRQCVYVETWKKSKKEQLPLFPSSNNISLN